MIVKLIAICAIMFSGFNVFDWAKGFCDKPMSALERAKKLNADITEADMTLAKGLDTHEKINTFLTGDTAVAVKSRVATALAALAVHAKEKGNFLCKMFSVYLFLQRVGMVFPGFL